MLVYHRLYQFAISWVKRMQVLSQTLKDGLCARVAHYIPFSGETPGRWFDYRDKACL